MSKKNGFTLIEATIAIAILLVGLMAVMQFFPFCLKIIGDSQNTTTASHLALAKIEEVQSSIYDNIITGPVEVKHRLASDPTDYLYNYQRQTIIETVDSSLNSSPTDVGLKKVTVTVFWNSPIGLQEKSVQINSLISRY